MLKDKKGRQNLIIDIGGHGVNFGARQGWNLDRSRYFVQGHWGKTKEEF